MLYEDVFINDQSLNNFSIQLSQTQFFLEKNRGLNNYIIKYKIEVLIKVNHIVVASYYIYVYGNYLGN